MADKLRVSITTKGYQQLQMNLEMAGIEGLFFYWSMMGMIQLD